MKNTSVNKICVLRCGELNLATPLADVMSVELANDIKPTLHKDSTTGGVEGEISLPQDTYRVVLMDSELKLLHYLSHPHPFVVCFHHNEFGAYGLLCDETTTLTLKDQLWITLPTVMNNGQGVFQGIMKHQTGTALLTDGLRLSAYFAGLLTHAQNTPSNTQQNSQQNTQPENSNNHFAA